MSHDALFMCVAIEMQRYIIAQAQVYVYAVCLKRSRNLFRKMRKLPSFKFSKKN